MPSIDPGRLAALVVCVSALFGLFVLGGSGWPAEPSPGLDLSEPSVEPEAHAGESVQTGGVVVDTDPVVLEIDREDDPLRIEIENAPDDVQVGEQLTVDGTLTADGTLEANPDRAVVREPWEIQYMYAVSIVGVLLVVGRAVDGWRFEPRTLTFHPRSTPLHRRVLRGEGERDG